MPVTIVVGAQWGDEGKGRVADWLARESDGIARYAGGDNAGHTVIVGDAVFKLHLVPSGVVHSDKKCFLGNGMVINPVRLVSELDMLAERGIDISPDRIHLSPRAHVITPGHMELDGAADKARGKDAIGTTKRGIGLAYTDKATRVGLLTGEMADAEQFADAVQHSIEQANIILQSKYGAPPMDAVELVAEYAEAARRLQPYLADTNALIHDMLEADQRLLCEGAQGTLLDIDHGHYPFVTSSNATTGGAMTGLGFGPHYVDRVIGVVKAYCTRVGNGPFPTELLDETGEQLRQAGHEFGTTTGRPRRCGWLDMVALKYAIRVNGFNELVLSKMDVLGGMAEIKIATAYELDGKPITNMPLDTAAMERAQPVYEAVPGWDADISGARVMADLPEATQRYIKRIEELSGVKVMMVSVGPERDQAVQL
ncbi:MAG: adenylosuccinate synthase [Anaerolineae bacterium]|nr:adenylosuccinate synthase [Anaerolineae bacterium]